MDDVGLLHFAKYCACLDLVARLYERFEGPLLLVGKTGRSHTTLDEVAHLVHKYGKGTLDTIIDTGQQTRTEFNCKRKAGIRDRFAGSDTGGIFIDLNDDTVTLDLDYLSHQLFFADLHHIVHVGVKVDCRHDRAGDSFQNPLFLFL